MKTAESFGLTRSESDSFNENELLLEYDDTGAIQDFRSRDCMQVDPVIASIARKKRSKIPLNREEAELSYMRKYQTLSIFGRMSVISAV